MTKATSDPNLIMSMSTPLRVALYRNPARIVLLAEHPDDEGAEVLDCEQHCYVKIGPGESVTVTALPSAVTTGLFAALAILMEGIAHADELDVQIEQIESTDGTPASDDTILVHI